MNAANNHEYFIKRCLDLARLALGNVKTNPTVGAVLVHEGKIIGEGYHKAFGTPHAEVNAIENVAPEHKGLIEHATLYVSLEPCAHFGKTPPCVDLILREKIPNVVITCTDPNPKVAGKSIQKLKDAGVNVITGVLRAQAEDLIAPFLKNTSKHLPYVILKWAQSADGFIGKPGQNIWISNQPAKRIAHKWRSEVDAIMAGTNTILSDNPRLNNRLYSGNSPIRVSFDRHGRLDPHLHLFDDSVQTIIFGATPKSANTFRQTQFLPVPENLTDCLARLFAQNIGTLLVEGGAQLLGAFIQENLWDEARVIKCPVCLCDGISAPVIPSRMIPQSYQLLDNKIEIYGNR